MVSAEFCANTASLRCGPRLSVPRTQAALEISSAAAAQVSSRDVSARASSPGSDSARCQTVAGCRRGRSGLSSLGVIPALLSCLVVARASLRAPATIYITCDRYKKARRVHTRSHACPESWPPGRSALAVATIGSPARRPALLRAEHDRLRL